MSPGIQDSLSNIKRYHFVGHGPSKRDTGVTAPSLTCVQQQLHDGEVGMRHAVVKGCVPASVSQVDKQLQKMWGTRLDLEEVSGHHGRAR